MIARTFSATLLGVNAVEIEIECREAEGNQFRMTVVGLPNAAVKDSRDRALICRSHCHSSPGGDSPLKPEGVQHNRGAYAG